MLSFKTTQCFILKSVNRTCGFLMSVDMTLNLSGSVQARLVL